QAMSKRMGIDHRTDIFSLGVALWETLALQRPFEGDTSQQVLEKIMMEDPPDPQKIRSRCPRDLSVICMKMIEKDPSHRFQSMTGLRADLHRFLSNEPIRAKPPTYVQRCVKWTRRHPVITTSGTVSILLLALAGNFFLQARAAEATAEKKTAALERVTDSFGALLNTADPVAARGEDLDTENLLNRASASILEELEGQPVAQAKLLRRISSIHYRRGDYLESVALSRQCLDILNSTSEVSPFDLYNTHELLALGYLQLQDLEEARRHLEIAAKGYETMSGADGILAMNVRANLAGISQKAGDLISTEQEMISVLTGIREQLGPEHPRTLTALGNLASHYLVRCKYKQAEVNTREAIAGYSKTLGADHPNALSFRMNLSSILLRQARWQEAHPIIALGLLDSNRVWGPDHPITISFLFNRGYCAVQAGELSEASSDYLEALRRVRETFSPSHPLTIFIEGYWADLLRLQGDPAKASLILARV
ncbi:MAG: tetratricopeptide repeat-containing protein kinase family protein, partial [Planctomycetota bacterium]|nr:tetratricopeptide repeat-containing protein kinase family protein [Planctomycetota bacterium]